MSSPRLKTERAFEAALDQFLEATCPKTVRHTGKAMAEEFAAVREMLGGGPRRQGGGRSGEEWAGVWGRLAGGCWRAGRAGRGGVDG